MAFFSNGNAEFLSLSLAPTGKGFAYVFLLNRSQARISLGLVQSLLPISLGIFALTFCAAAAAILGVRPLGFSDARYETLLMILASCAALIAYSEVAFFLWVKATRDSRLSETSRLALMNMQVLSSKSGKAYLIFLLNLMVPVLAILALPGGAQRYFTDFLKSGAGFQFFIFQLAVVAAVLMAFLIKRTIALLKMGTPA